MITSITDWGRERYHIAQAMGIMRKITPKIELVEITNDVFPFSVLNGVHILNCTYKYFEWGTIHVASVGGGTTERKKGVLVKTRNYYFIGPDNGILWEAAHEDGIERIISLENEEFFNNDVSCTLLGRDVYFPVAAHLYEGIPLINYGKELKKMKKFEIPKPKRSKNGVEACVLHLDCFGNVRTNIKERIMEGKRGAAVIGKEDFPFRIVRCYDEAKEGELVMLEGATGFLEFSMNFGNASQVLKKKVGENISLKFF